MFTLISEKLLLLSDLLQSLIPFRLGLIHGIIMPPPGHQLLVAAVLHNASLPEHQNPVHQPGDSQPMGNQQGGAVPREPGEIPVQLRFGDGVQGGGGLVQDHDVRPAAVDGIPAYEFDVPMMLVSLVCFIIIYEILMYVYSEKIKKISIKEIMIE